MDMVVKDTPDGICIYCRKCTERKDINYQKKKQKHYAVNGVLMQRNLNEKLKEKKDNI